MRGAVLLLISLVGCTWLQAAPANTVVKITTDAAGVGAQIRVDGKPWPMLSPQDLVSPVGKIPAERAVFLDLGDNRYHRIELVARDASGATRILAANPQVAANRGVIGELAIRVEKARVEEPGLVIVPPPVNPPLVVQPPSADSSIPLVLLGVTFLVAAVWWLFFRGGNAVTDGPWPPEWSGVLRQRFPHLRAKRKLTAGGMGTIFVVRNQRRASGQPAADSAVKVLHPQFNEEAGPEAHRFLDEARVMQKLGGTGLVPRIYSVTPDGPGSGAPLWFEMEFLDGWTPLRRHIGGKDRRRIEGPRAAVWIDCLAAIVQNLHDQDVIHRDLSPENVMINGVPGHMRLIDFGLARWSGRSYRDDQLRSAHFTQPGEHVGKPRYCAPEQWEEGLAAAGPAADWYAVGVMAWETVMGRPPYESPGECHRRTARAADLREQGIAAELAKVVANGLLSPNPRDRLGAAAELTGGRRA
jgi:hypothetical protein